MNDKEIYEDLLVKTVVKNATSIDVSEVIEFENNREAYSDIKKSEKVMSLFENPDKEFTDSDLKLKKKKKHNYKMYMRIAACILVVILVGTVSVTIATGSHVHLLNLIFNKDSTSATTDDNPKNDDGFFEFNYIPKGFTIESMELDMSYYRKTFINCDKVKLAIIQTQNATVNFDADVEPESIIVDDVECMFFDNEDNYSMVFKVDEVLVDIILTDCDWSVKDARKEMVKIVENRE